MMSSQTNTSAVEKTTVRRSSSTRRGLKAITAVGGLAILAGTGAGVASSANAATASSASTTLAKIKYCESGGNYRAVNASSGASGAYQFLDSTWKGLSAGKGYATAASAPASVQDAAALELYGQMGTSPWAASSSCWSSMTSAPASTTSTTVGTTSSTTASSASTTATSTTPKAYSTTSGATAHTAAPTTRTPHGKPAQRPGARIKAPAHHGKHHAKPMPQRLMKPANPLPPMTAPHGDIPHHQAASMR